VEEKRGKCIFLLTREKENLEKEKKSSNKRTSSKKGKVTPQKFVFLFSPKRYDKKDLM